MTETAEPLEAVITWKATDGSLWQLCFYVKPVAGRAECVGLDITSHPYAEGPERGTLSAATMRDLDFATQLARARRDALPRLRRLMDLGRRLGVLDDSELADEAAVMAQGAGREGGRHAPYTKDERKRVVDEYLQAVATGSTTPTRDVSEHLGMSRHQAAKLVQRCRKKGLLPKTDRGVARGATEEGKP